MSVEFRTDFEIKSLDKKINYSSNLFFIGSCFSENIALKLQRVKFNSAINPFGIIYNPISIAEEIIMHIDNKIITEGNVFEENGIYKNFDFHSRISHPDKNTTLQLMNDAVKQGNEFLKNISHLIITFGTSRVYILKNSGKIVANNHKQASLMFERLQLKENDIENVWCPLIDQLKAFNPEIKIIFTVSPVRHFKDGAVENSRSKAILINSVHGIIEKYPDCYYFPSYELIMDDLRDYRFYEKDMLHPNEIAIEYIFEKFVQSCIEKKCLELMNAIEEIKTAMEHKPFFPELNKHKEFKENMLEKLQMLQQGNSEINFAEEIEYFNN